MTNYNVEVIGYIRTCFDEKFGIPRQPLLVPSATGCLTLAAPFNDPDTILGLEQVSHVWLSFIFHQHVGRSWKAKVRPPRLGGNKKVGVFATRSSFRPNNMGLSVVKLEQISFEKDQVVLYVSGVDLLDGTPIIDIKPYVPYADSLPEAINTLAEQKPSLLSVEFSDASLESIDKVNVVAPQVFQQLVMEVLQQDPRPAYHMADEERVYGMNILQHNVQWFYQKNKSGVERIVVSSVVLAS